MEQVKSYIAYLFCLLSFPAGFLSCTDEISPEVDGDQIILQLNIPGNKTRATVEGEDAFGENTLDRIDLFIFKSTDGSLEAYQAYSGLDVKGSCTTVLDKAKTDFPVGDRFDIYAIANYPGNVNDLKAITNLSGLQTLTVTDANVYKREVTRRFLMDGTRKNVALNDGNTTATTIPIDLKRAAAKIKVNLRCTNNFPTDNHLTLTGYSSYRLVNYVAHTPVLDEAEPFSYPPLNIMSTHIPITTAAVNPFQPGLDKGASFVVYSFANDWSPPRDINNATYLIVNLIYTPDGGTSDKNSYYKIVVNYNQFPDPAKEENRLKRNSFYEVTATVDKKGSETEEIPTPVNCTYRIAEWRDRDVEIEDASSSASAARYLMVSENTVSLANLETTNQIKYYASAPIAIGAVTITYVNNRGVETAITTTTTPFGARVLVNNLAYGATPPTDRGYIRPVRTAQADVTTEENGYLEIVSRLLNLSGKNSLLVKEIRFTVSLNDGGSPTLSETIVITQYPEVYATQTQGWFSFKEPMSTRTGGSAGSDWAAYRQCDLKIGIGTVIDLDKGYNGNTNGTPYSTHVVNKYNETYIDNNRIAGSSDICAYGSYTAGTTQSWSAGTSPTHYNAHIYYVHVSTIPAGRTLAYPVITGTFDNDNTTSNANTISPAFMIASQLGVTSSNAGRPVGYDHCKNYVEVTYRYPEFAGKISGGKYSEGNGLSDWVVYSDWRLPTAAEIGIIADYQNNDGAVAIVLAGQRYYALTGSTTETVNALSSGSNGNYIRCVRDVKPGDPNFNN
ncbi:MAG: hypothetical protein AB2L24_03575 [Mangrovibacterium sp.]